MEVLGLEAGAGSGQVLVVGDGDLSYSATLSLRRSVQACAVEASKCVLGFRVLGFGKLSWWLGLGFCDPGEFDDMGWFVPLIE